MLCQVIIKSTSKYSTCLRQKCSCRDMEESMRRSCLTINTLKYICFRVNRLIGITIESVDGVRDDIESMKRTITADVTALISDIISNILKPTEDILNEMVKENWAPQDVKDDWDTDYMYRMTQVIAQRIDTAKGIVLDEYLLKMCKSVTELFFERYNLAIFKCKRINEIGSQMLFMDYSTSKPFFLKLPNRSTQITLEGINEELLPKYDNSEYIVDCTRAYSIAENIYKVLQISDKEKALSTFKFLFKEYNEEVFTQIWNMKEKQSKESTTELLKSIFTFTRK